VRRLAAFRALGLAGARRQGDVWRFVGTGPSAAAPGVHLPARGGETMSDGKEDSTLPTPTCDEGTRGAGDTCPGRDGQAVALPTPGHGADVRLLENRAATHRAIGDKPVTVKSGVAEGTTMLGLRCICVIAAVVCGACLAPPASGDEGPGQPASRPATSQPGAEAALREVLRQAQALQAQGKPAGAAALYEKAVEILEGVHGKEHPTTAEMLKLAADQRKAAGEYAKAVRLWDRILKIREAKLGSEHLEVAQGLFEQGWLYANMGFWSQNKAQFARAELLLLRCLKIREAKLGKEHLDVAAVLHELGWLCIHTIRYAEAEPLFARNLQIREASPSQDGPMFVRALDNLARLHERTKEYAKAEPFRLRILKIKETGLGKEHLQVADCLGDLASLYDKMGQQAKAESCRQRSQEIRKAQPRKGQ
jgi:tetratricopeptide (TPR) repeat protein